MTLLTVWTGVILASILVPLLLVLYFLRLRRRAAPIACTLLWKRSVEDLRANAPFQRLRSSVLLFLQLLAILLLAAALMQPQIEGGTADGGKTVIMIDNSTSMLATDGPDGRTRLDEAKELAKKRIEALYDRSMWGGSDAETMVLAFSDRAEVYARFSTSRQELLDAVDRIRPTHGATQLDEALKLARAYTTNVDPESDRPVASPAALEIFTDGRIADIDEQVLRGETMRYYRVGETTDNVSLATIDVQRPYDRPAAVEVFASILNHNPESVTCDLQLSVNGSAIAIREVQVAASTIDPSNGQAIPGRNNVVFSPFEQPRDAVIEVANLRADALDADNVVHAVVPPPRQLVVGLVTDGSRLIETVLAGMPLERIDRMTPEQFTRRMDGGFDGYDVVVLDDVELDGPLPPGRYLSFGAVPQVAGLNVFGESQDQIVLRVREEHPAMRFVNMDQLYIARSVKMQPDDDVRVLAEGSDCPLVVEASRDTVRVVHVAFDPLESNWPFLRSFVTFMFNAVDYLGRIGDVLTEEALTPGDALTARVPVQASDIQLRAPDGNVVPLSIVDDTGAVSYGPLRYSGIYTIEWDEGGEPQSRAVAVARADEKEGAIAPEESIEIGSETVAGLAGGAGTYTPLWPWALALCLLLLTFEWWIYHKKTSI